jgi:hypothetical protein
MYAIGARREQLHFLPKWTSVPLYTAMVKLPLCLAIKDYLKVGCLHPVACTRSGSGSYDRNM